jgi:hypothetical protein
MNYFSHFIVDHQPGNREYNTGLLLPDITKSWIKSFRHPEPGNHFSVHENDLLKGCFRHYDSDKAFHSSPFFNKYYELLHTSIKNELGDEVGRKWFISHITFELLLDRLFVKAFPSLLEAFYDSLSLVDEPALRKFLHFYGMKEDGEFLRFFNHFRSIRYIYYYTDNNKFLYSLNRIMMRVNIPPLTETNEKQLLAALLPFEEKYFSNANKVLEELKAVFT